MNATMKVRMRVGISGTRSGEAWPQPGEVLVCSLEEGRQLCQAGIAVPEPEPEPEPDEVRVEKAVAPKTTVEKRPGRPAKTE